MEAGSQAEKERRGGRRISAGVPVTFHTETSEADVFSGTCLDVSSGGVQIQTRAPLRIGDRVRFAVRLGGFERVSYHARVCWAAAAPDAVRVGCRFETAA